MREHTRRQRAPRGFSTSVILRLTEIQRGSVIPVLARDEKLDQDALIAPVADYFDRARNLINDTLSSLNRSNSLDPRFPAECLKEFASFGRSLREGERIEFSDVGRSPVAFEPGTRKLLQEIAQLERLDVEMQLQGQITGLRSNPQQFDFIISSSGRRIIGNYADSQLWDSLNEFHGQAERAPMVALSAVVEQSLNGNILGISDVINVEAALPVDWSERIEYLSSLRAGWLHKDAIAPTAATLDRTEQILLACVDEGIERPGIFPSEEGGVNLEWSNERIDLEVEISSSGSAQGLIIYKKESTEQEEKFGDNATVDAIITFIEGAFRD
jgi:hypothetical protein